VNDLGVLNLYDVNYYPQTKLFSSDSLGYFSGAIIISIPFLNLIFNISLFVAAFTAGFYFVVWSYLIANQLESYIFKLKLNFDSQVFNMLTKEINIYGNQNFDYVLAYSKEKVVNSRINH